MIKNHVSDFAARLNMENSRHSEKMIQRREQAKTEALHLAGLLVSKMPEIDQIWGFGSTFENNRPFMESSDIDLAIEGGDIFAGIKIIEKSTFRVDLIDITGKNDKFSEMIRQYGQALV